MGYEDGTTRINNYKREEGSAAITPKPKTKAYRTDQAIPHRLHIKAMTRISNFLNANSSESPSVWAYFFSRLSIIILYD